MSNLEIRYQETNQKIKSKYFTKLCIFAAILSFIFALYSHLIIKNSILRNIEIIFGVLILSIAQLHIKSVIKYKFAVHSFHILALLIIGLISMVNGGITAPGIFFFPTFAMSISILLDKESTRIWSILIYSVIILFMIMKVQGFEVINFQIESKRHISHFMNFTMLFLYVFSLSSLNSKLKEEVEETNHLILRDLYNENRLNNVSQIVGGIAHEINNPLSISSGNISLLRKYLQKLDLDEDKKVERILINMDIANDRISNIVKDLKLFNNNEEHEVCDFNLSQSIFETVNFLNETMTQNEVFIEYNYPQQEYNVQGVPSQFQQVLLNILKNSLDALEGRDHKIIDIILDEKESVFELIITDNGHGISDENMKKVFDPFFTTKGQKGTGLGLGITRSIIQDMNGKIFYDSKVDKGTSVTITLPKANSQNQSFGKTVA